MPARPVVVGIAAFLSSATVLSIVALATPEWIVQDLQGTVTYGLVHECYDRSFVNTDITTCTHNEHTPPEWYTTLVFVIIGTICVAISTFYALKSIAKPIYLKQSKVGGLAASVLFSFATLIFPGGFDAQTIGGSPYRSSMAVALKSVTVLLIRINRRQQ